MQGGVGRISEELKPGLVDFANVLFSGPCNRFCPWCIGKKVPASANQNNLTLFPLNNLERYLDAIEFYQVPQIVFTGTNTDPQLYRYEVKLLNLMRERLTINATYSLHTNGVLALRKQDEFNQYDKACISFPSFVPETYYKLMGSAKVPDLERIVQMAKMPIKISCVINDYNQGEMNSFLERCSQIGIKRVVLRRLFGDSLDRNPLRDLKPQRWYRNNPVYDCLEMEVTYWEFDTSTSKSINLFSNGAIGTSYLLTETKELQSNDAQPLYV